MDTDDGRSVLVTGGRGFIGCAVAKLLQREGYKVVSLDATALASSRAAEDEVLCDLTNAAQLQRIFEERRIGGIVHLAAILPTAAQARTEARDPGQRERQPPFAGVGAALWRRALCFRQLSECVWHLLWE